MAEGVFDLDYFLVVLLIAVCVACYWFSSRFDRKVRETYCGGCINWWLSAVTAALAASAVLLESGGIFRVTLILALISAAVSGWLIYGKLKGWGASSKEAGLGAAAQIASSVGLAITILFVLILFFGNRNSGKRKKR